MTEVELLRLTAPAYNTWLLPPGAPSLSRRGDTLLCTSDRTGELHLFRLDTKTGNLRQLSSQPLLRRDAAALLPDERALLADSTGLRVTGRPRELIRLAAGESLAAGLVASRDGALGAAVLTSGQGSQLLLVPLNRLAPPQRLTLPEPLSPLAFRPGTADLLLRGATGIWLLRAGGTRPDRILPDMQEAHWHPQGQTVLYLTRAAAPQIAEWTYATGRTEPVTPASAPREFGPNGNATVFATASNSRACPCINLNLRSPRREMALCEHRISGGEPVYPTFALNSQTLFFQTNRPGKMCVYRVAVDRLVERTE